MSSNLNFIAPMENYSIGKTWVAIQESVKEAGEFLIAVSEIYRNHELIHVDFNLSDVPPMIEAKCNSTDTATRLEGEVAQVTSQNTTVEAVGLKIKTPAGGQTTEVDIVTTDYIIEVKTSSADIDYGQLARLTQPGDPGYFNYARKGVIYYIEDTTSAAPQDAAKLAALENAGVKVVSSADELIGVLTV